MTLEWVVATKLRQPGVCIWVSGPPKDEDDQVIVGRLKIRRPKKWPWSEWLPLNWDNQVFVFEWVAAKGRDDQVIVHLKLVGCWLPKIRQPEKKTWEW